MTDEEIINKSLSLTKQPEAIEAFWDGDSSGWFITLAAIFKKEGSLDYEQEYLACLQGETGDLRAFNNQVPPWSETERAKNIGKIVAQHYGIEFYFPSPDYPEDECPRWWKKAEGYPCQSCGIPLLQNEPCPWKGYCYQCHLRNRQQKK